MARVNKEDLRLNADNYSITLESTAGERLYRKKIDLPEEIEPNTGKSTYKNGILEVSLSEELFSITGGLVHTLLGRINVALVFVVLTSASQKRVQIPFLSR